MKKIFICFMTLFALGVVGFISYDYPEEDEYLTLDYNEEYDTDDDYSYCQYEEEDEYLVQCEGGKCPREMVERLRREKRAERARMKSLQDEKGEEPDLEEEEYLV